MSDKQIGRAGWLAIGLALLGSLAASANEFVGFRNTGTVDWGHIALIIGVPVFMYAVVASRKAQDGGR